ncbi:hypothetical protein ZHAS_00006441 [Anopheles sinensis]|uniref:Uncharacterized protein n=1 Tax=Anopheles sinensis TaxID=74873 RepID=A0A084VMB9_ANOSI|nr:hypothetical protein ZHAS_00006441 [Anopheles sinensis]
MSTKNVYAISIERFQAKAIKGSVGSTSVGAGGGGGSDSSSSSLLSGGEATAAGSLLSDLRNDNLIDIEPGMTLQIVEEVSSKIALIKIKDFHRNDGEQAVTSTKTDRIFQCQSVHLQRIPADIWPFMIAILDPQERCEFAKRSKLFDSVKNLTMGDNVKVKWLTKNGNVMYDCTVRYIGPVEMLGPGYYFGLQLLNLNNGESPQKDDIAFVLDYMDCEPRLALIVAANWIVFSEQDFLYRGKQHHPKRNLLGSLVSSARDLNNRITRRAGGDLGSKSAARSGSKSSVNGDFQPYTQRSYTPDLTTGATGGGGGVSNRKSTDLDALCDSFSCLPMDPTGAKAMQHKKMAASISSPNLSKQDSSSSTGSSGRYVQSHPVESLMMHTHGQNHSHHHHHHHQHAVNDEAYRSSGRSSSQNSSNSSTLKHSKARTSKSGHRPTGSNTSVNSGGFLSLPDRDLVVIDPSEIDEANKSAGNVILVNPPRSPVLSPTDSGGVDLMDLLHSSSSWPAEAGVVADSQNLADKKTQTPSSLSAASYGNGGLNVGYNTGSSSASSNSTSSTSHYNHNGTATERTNGRTKSLNPLAHFGNSKPGEVPPLSTARKAARTAAVEAKPATVDVATMTSK